jgi:hypothetical protein
MSVPDQGYSYNPLTMSVPDQGYSYNPLTMSVPDQGYSWNVSLHTKLHIYVFIKSINKKNLYSSTLLIRPLKPNRTFLLSVQISDAQKW